MYVPEDQTVPEGLASLVSFPRTGSHWLRMFLELYFDRPMLTRHFFEHESAEMLLYHTHDDYLKFVPSGPVIYLYRNPVDVVFSELTYHHGDDAARVDTALAIETAERYRKNLRRWLLGQEGVSSEVVLAYEWLLDDPARALAPVIEFFGGSFEQGRMDSCWEKVTPQEVRERTEYNESVIDRGAQKELRRALFRYRLGPEVRAHFTDDRELMGVVDERVFGAGV